MAVLVNNPGYNDAYLYALDPNNRDVSDSEYQSYEQGYKSYLLAAIGGNLPEETTYIIEQRTSDYAASVENVGLVWMRTDLSECTVRTVVESDGVFSVETFEFYVEPVTETFIVEQRTTDYAATAENVGLTWMNTTESGSNVKTVVDKDGVYSVELYQFEDQPDVFVIEQRTTDYPANASTVGLVWMRTDESTSTVKTVVDKDGVYSVELFDFE